MWISFLISWSTTRTAKLFLKSLSKNAKIGFEVSFVAPYALGVFFAFLWLDKMTFDGLWQFRSIESRWFFVFQMGSLISLCVPFLVAHRLVAEHWGEKFGSSDKVDLALRLAYSSSVSVSHFRRLNENLQWYFWQSYFWQSHFWRHRPDAYAVAIRQIRIFAADE